MLFYNRIENVAFAFAVAFAVAVAGAFAGAVAVAGAGAVAGAFAVAVVQTMLSIYIAYRAMKGDEKYALVRNIAIAFAASYGTSFRDANLTDADFTNATLKSTDFRGSNITRTCWKNTIKLDRIRPGKTYLKDTKVRELVKTGEGENINLDRSILQGINLQGANLTNASFIEANLNSANLQDANLTRAKLVGTFLDQADLTGATLTGAFLEDWGITTSTKLNGIKCDYVYMRLPPEKRPDFLKLPPKDAQNDNPIREPADWNKNFKEGEFIDFITPMIETLNFYHAEKADPKLIAYSFQKLQNNYPEAELEMISMERRGKNRQDLLVKAETAPAADHSKLHAEYFETYDRLEALPPNELQLILAEKDKQIKRLAAWVDSVIKSPNISAKNYYNQGDTKMSENTGDKVDINENYGVVGKEGEIHGAVGNKGEIYGLAGSQGEINNSKIARTINESPEQNLAQAAKDIQELLEQLDQTYPSDTTMDRMKMATEVITQINNNSTKKERIFAAIKAGGIAAFEQLLNHPASSFVIAALEDWQKTK